ncbi:hypothetical protein G7046_g1272 [Stylonectria norvegica]|nr:hypothetical protein G7046_g1272 [Stylonectria norvegica]
MEPSSNARQLSARQSRVVGALLGVHAGDSLGATVEFQPHASIAKKYPDGLRDIVGGGPFSWPVGHATDDTDMTRGTLLAYRDFKPGDDIARLAGDYFLDWRNGNWPGRTKGRFPADIGNATRDGLSRYRKTRDPDNAGAGEGRSGNGSLMRCIPTGLFELDPEQLIIDSISISKITHDDSRCTTACAAYNTIVWHLIRGASPNEAIDAGESVAIKLEKRDSSEVYRAIRQGRTLQIAQMAREGPPKEMKGRCAGYVLETLTLAIAAVLDMRSLEDVLVDVVRIGNDTDTNAAVAGGILGARDGAAAIPERWASKLQFRNEFRTIPLELVKE